MSTPRTAFRAGARAILPFLVGVVVFGSVAGSSARDLGLSALQSATLAGLLFAGAAELVTLDLLARGAPLLVVVATALIVNARLALYAAALSPHMTGLSGGQRLGLAAFVTDQPFVLTWRGFATPLPSAARAAYFLGAALPMWITWQAAHLAGFAYGARLPAQLSLDFALPLTFVAVLVPRLRERGPRTAALVAAGLYPVCAGLPLQLGLCAAAGAGVLVSALRGGEPRA